MQPEREDMNKDLGASADAETGSRADASSPQAVSTEGFDPARYVSGADAAELWPDREHLLYYPCDLGVHLCGANHEDNYFYTIGNFPCAAEEEATALWLAMKAECEVDREAADFLVDRNGVDGHDDDFWTNRQMLARIDAIATEARRAATVEQGAVHEGAGPQDIAQGPSQ